MTIGVDSRFRGKDSGGRASYKLAPTEKRQIMLHLPVDTGLRLYGEKKYTPTLIHSLSSVRHYVVGLPRFARNDNKKWSGFPPARE